MDAILLPWGPVEALGFLHKVDGRIIPVQIPTAVLPVSVSTVPNNLGIVLKAERIRELESLF